MTFAIRFSSDSGTDSAGDVQGEVRDQFLVSSDSGSLPPRDDAASTPVSAPPPAPPPSASAPRIPVRAPPPLPAAKPPPSEIAPPILEIAPLSCPKVLNCTLVVRRIAKSSIKGKHFYFDMPSEAGTKYYAKSLSSRPSNTMIPISTNSDIHMKSQTEYQLACEKGSRTFVLRRNETVVLTYTLLKDDVKSLHIPDFSRVTIDDSIETAVRKFVSMRPKMSKQGFWFLDFHNRFTIPSPRNAIYVQDNPGRNGDEMFTVRQIAKDTLEFDLMYDIPELLIFAVGVAAFCAKHK
jgi:hypothetical protein